MSNKQLIIVIYMYTATELKKSFRQTKDELFKNLVS